MSFSEVRKRVVFKRVVLPRLPHTGTRGTKKERRYQKLERGVPKNGTTVQKKTPRFFIASRPSAPFLTLRNAFSSAFLVALLKLLPNQSAK